MKKYTFKNISVFFVCFIILCSTISFALATNTYDLTYDDNGNLVQDIGEYYEYNSFNQLKRVREDNAAGRIIAEYFYDSGGERIKKVEFSTDGTDTTTYYVDGSFVRVVNESGSFDTVYYHLGGDLIARKDSDGEKYFYHPDHLGSTNLVTDLSGNTVEETHYLPFGEVIDGGESRFLFTGQEKDKETSLMYYGARYYSPFLRRFTQPDTIIQDIYDPQSLNRYAYARNNPVKYTDPTGHWIHIVGGFAIGALFGGGFSIYSQMRYGGASWSTLNWGAVGKAAAVGSIAGGVGAATFGLGLYAYGTGIAGYTAAGAMTGLTAGRAAQFTSNAVERKSLKHNMFNTKDMAVEILVGAAGGAFAKGTEKVFLAGMKMRGKPFQAKSGKGVDIVGTKYNRIKPTQKDISPIRLQEKLELIDSGGKPLVRISNFGTPGKNYVTDGSHSFVAYNKRGVALENMRTSYAELTKLEKSALQRGGMKFQEDWSKVKYNHIRGLE